MTADTLSILMDDSVLEVVSGKTSRLKMPSDLDSISILTGSRHSVSSRRLSRGNCLAILSDFAGFLLKSKKSAVMQTQWPNLTFQCGFGFGLLHRFESFAKVIPVAAGLSHQLRLNLVLSYG
jgi:hypothetical protein